LFRLFDLKDLISCGDIFPPQDLRTFELDQELVGTTQGLIALKMKATYLSHHLACENIPYDTLDRLYKAIISCEHIFSNSDTLPITWLTAGPNASSVAVDGASSELWREWDEEKGAIESAIQQKMATATL
jgi:hypothetical protein